MTIWLSTGLRRLRIWGTENATERWTYAHDIYLCKYDFQLAFTNYEPFNMSSFSTSVILKKICASILSCIAILYCEKNLRPLKLMRICESNFWVYFQFNGNLIKFNTFNTRSLFIIGQVSNQVKFQAYSRLF